MVPGRHKKPRSYNALKPKVRKLHLILRGLGGLILSMK